MCLNSLPLQACLGLLFPFLPVPGLSRHLSLSGDKAVFPHLGLLLLLDSSTTAPHGFNGAGNPFRWCCSPTWPPRPHTGSHKAEFGFSPRNEVTPPPKGEGLACSPIRVVSVCWICSQLAHTSPTGPVWCCAGVVSLPAPQNRTQALTGPSLVFTVFFSHLFSLAAWSVAAPGGNSPPREWARSCKAASRFSRSRPMSTLWSAGFR